MKKKNLIYRGKIGLSVLIAGIIAMILVTLIGLIPGVAIYMINTTGVPTGLSLVFSGIMFLIGLIVMGYSLPPVAKALGITVR